MKKMFLLMTVAAAWIACDRDDECPPPAGDSQQIAVQAEIAGSELASGIAPESKTTIIGSSAAWKEGDQLGLFCTQSVPNASNLIFTAAGNGASATWSTANPVYWGAPASTAHTFLAYAPYASGNTAAAVKLPALTGQTGTISSSLDLLISNNLGSSGVLRSGGAVGLTFTHALALIEFDITIGAGVSTTNTTLTSFTVAAGSSDKVYTTTAGTSTIALATGAITASTTASDLTNTATMQPTAPPTLSTSTPATVYALVLPGTYSAVPTLAVVLSEGGTTVSVPATALDASTKTFAAGSKYTYAVNIARTVITISNPTITPWTNVPGTAINPSL